MAGCGEHRRPLVTSSGLPSGTGQARRITANQLIPADDEQWTKSCEGRREDPAAEGRREDRVAEGLVVASWALVKLSLWVRSIEKEGDIGRSGGHKDARIHDNFIVFVGTWQ